MKQNNLKLKNLSKKPLRKKKASFGVFLKRNLWLYGLAARIVNRFRHTDKPLNENIKLYEPRKRLTLNFKSWHKVSAVALSLGIIATVVFFQFAPERMS